MYMGIFINVIKTSDKNIVSIILLVGSFGFTS